MLQSLDSDLVHGGRFAEWLAAQELKDLVPRDHV
jgi:hypothetical protein